MKNENSVKYDCVIIGAGSAGLRAFKALSKGGLKVMLVDRGPLGTTCARVGCMPSKAFLALPHLIERFQKFSEFVIQSQKDKKFSIHGKAWMDETRRLRNFFADDMVETTLRIAPDIRLEHAMVIDDEQVLVGDEIIKTRAVLLATGSRANWPSWAKELKDSNPEAAEFLHDEQSFFEQNDIDKDWAIIGSGPIGLELGGALNTFNPQSKVFARTSKSQLLSYPMLQEKLSDLTANFVEVFNVQKVEYVRGKFVISDNKRKLKFDRILLATGRSPRFADLFLNESLYIGDDGTLPINNKTLRIGRSSIFVAGDFSGRAGILHESQHEGDHAALNIIRYLKKKKLKSITEKPYLRIVFSAPQIVNVGKNYLSLVKSQTPHSIFEYNLKRNGRARTERDMDGMGALFFDLKDRFIGAELLGGPAEHLGHLLTLALQNKNTRDDLKKMTWYHPSVEEVFKHL